jgi:murein peptide amidase A
LIAILSLATSTAGAAEREVIGRSVQGRQIVSVRSGPSDPALRVLVIGATHGNETAGMRIARRLIRSDAPLQPELHQISYLPGRKFDAVRGRGVEFVVVPTMNPDGVASHSRGNARGVDLNRNFPFDWHPLSGGEYSGPRPLSEPESRAAHRLILRIRPDLTIWFHQPFGLVDRPAGAAFAARRYSQLIGLPLVNLPGRYPGSASRWQNHRLPRSEAFVVELPHHVSNTLVARGAAGILTLAAELGSPAIGWSG